MSEFHHHVRDELEAVIALDAHRCDVDARTVANRCVHTLVLLGVLPETDAETTPAAGDLVTRLRRWRNVASAVDAHEAADEIERLRAALREVRALHQPEWASEQARAAGKEPWVCALCGTADGLWPCATVATIREVLGDE